MASNDGPRLTPVPPPPREEGGERPPAEGREGGGLRRAALAGLALLAAVAVVGWIGASREADRLESALAERTRALEAARDEIRSWEGHREDVSARLEALSGELASVRALVERGPEGEGAGDGLEGPDSGEPAPEAPTEP